MPAAPTAAAAPAAGSRFPHLEPSGPPVPMTEEQKFLFDLRGWMLIPAVLDSPQIEAVRAHVETLAADPQALDPIDRFSLSGPAQILLDHPAVTGILEEIVGHNKDDQSYGFRCEDSFGTVRHEGSRVNREPHGGGNNVSPLFSYQCKNGSIYSGLTRVVWELTEITPRTGGTLFLSGSHKANFPRPASIGKDHPYFDSYACPPGSVVIFSEAICHSGDAWTNPDHPRVAVFNCYSRIDTQFHRLNTPPEVIEAMPPRRRTLFRGVWAYDFESKQANNWFGRENHSL